MNIPVSIEVISYTSNKEKRAAVRVFRKEFPYSRINASDGIVTCEHRLDADRSVFAY